MKNSFTSFAPNTCSWSQQEWTRPAIPIQSVLHGTLGFYAEIQGLHETFGKYNQPNFTFFLHFAIMLHVILLVLTLQLLLLLLLLLLKLAAQVQSGFFFLQTHKHLQTPTPENKCTVVTNKHRGVTKDTLHQPQNTNSLSDTRDNKTHMVFEGKFAELTTNRKLVSCFKKVW